MPGGQPTKLTDKMKERVKFLAVKGFTDKEIAKAVDVSESTIDNWKNQDPEFLGSLRDWKKTADEDVKRSLFESATGYSCKEEKVLVVDGSIETKTIDKRYAPNPTACIFWLKNRQPKEWRDKQEVEVTGDDALINALTAARNRAGKE